MSKIAEGEQITLTAGDNIEIVNNVISVRGIEKKFVKTFTKSNFVYDTQTKCWVYKIPKSIYVLENAYITNIYITNAVDKNGISLVNEPTKIMYSETKDFNENIGVYISFDLTKLSAYEGKIIIKGD